MIQINDVVYFQRVLEVMQGKVISINKTHTLAYVEYFIDGKANYDTVRLNNLHQSEVTVLRQLIDEKTEMINNLVSNRDELITKLASLETVNYAQ